MPVGLHQGLQSLTDGGIPPKLLIIDDGWQSTDIDSTLREDVSDRLRLPEKNTELDETQGEFIEAELEMLQMSAKNIPAGSALGKQLDSSVGILFEYTYPFPDYVRSLCLYCEQHLPVVRRICLLARRW